MFIAYKICSHNESKRDKQRPYGFTQEDIERSY